MSAPARPHEAGEIGGRDGRLSLRIAVPPPLVRNAIVFSFIILRCNTLIAVSPPLACGAGPKLRTWKQLRRPPHVAASLSLPSTRPPG